jgi:predicted dehydrogenase
MASRERRLKDGIEAVAIVTPNHMHFPVANAFLRAGIHVICDKPLVHRSSEARKLQKLARERDLVFAVTYNYTGYPLVRQAREMVRAGALGDVRVVQVEYPQDWLSEKLEDTGQKQAAWRTDPARSGIGGCVGDIGTHAYHLACFVTGLELEALCADLSRFVGGRTLDDNVQVLMRFRGGARGMLWASQVAPGNENALRLRVYGSKGGLEWRQEDPNCLLHSPLGAAPQRITRGGPGSDAAAGRLTRLPPGHPEGYLEGFANIYGEVAAAIRARRKGCSPDNSVDFPTVDDGARGVAFIEAAVRSSERGAKWVTL